MNRLIIILFLVALSMCNNSHAKGKFISGEVPRGNRIIDGVQYIYEGSPLFDLEEAPVVAEIDTSDHSITLFVPSIAPQESLYIQFIPRSLFSACLSTEIIWDEQSKTYQYNYTISSDAKSITAIWNFELEWWNDYFTYFKPEGWLSEPKHSRRANCWSTFSGNMIKCGDTLSGFGFESYGPPTLCNFEMWGGLKILGQHGEDEEFGSIYSGISGKYRGIKGYTVAAWVSPESIEPVDWFANICFKVPILVSSGYMEKEIQQAIYPTLYKLYEDFQLKENQSLDKLEQEVNNALDFLEPYQDQMEPEAEAFIFENLRYILRHQDIVKFKEYP